MKVTLTKKVGTHAKGATVEVTPAVARRLIDKGVATKDTPSPKSDTPDKQDTPSKT